MAWEWVGPVATAAVGIAGFVSQHLMVGRQHKIQRETANDDRLWHKRAATYVDLLKWAGDQRTHINSLGTDITALNDYADKVKLPHDLHAGLTAFASGAVFSAAMKFVGALSADAGANAYILDKRARLERQGQPQSEEQRRFDDAMVTSAGIELDSRADHMAQVISDDLHDQLAKDHGQPQALSKYQHPATLAERIEAAVNRQMARRKKAESHDDPIEP